MPTLYSLHLSDPRWGFGKPAVTAVVAGFAGHLCPETGEIVMPEPEAVRSALPHYYRKAFDRAAQRFTFRDAPGSAGIGAAAHVALRDSRGRYLNTLYAIPYTFRGDEYRQGAA